MNSLDVMKQTLAYLENGHFTYETKIADDLRAAIQQEEANIQTQITKDNLQAAAVTSLQCAHCQVTIETLNDKVMRTLAEVEQLKARDLGLDHEPVPVKTYSGGKAWPVQMQWVEYETGNHTKRHWEWLNKQDEQEIKDNCTTVACVLKSVKAKLKEKNSKV
jgi:hypothetical protein